MSVKEMSDEQLSQWIIEKLGFYKGGCGWHDATATFCLHHEPDMCSDPTMTVMLLGQLLDTGKAYWLERRGDGIVFQRSNAAQPRFCSTLSRAVAEAWALANGLETETER